MSLFADGITFGYTKERESCRIFPLPFLWAVLVSSGAKRHGKDDFVKMH